MENEKCLYHCGVNICTCQSSTDHECTANTCPNYKDKPSFDGVGKPHQKEPEAPASPLDTQVGGGHYKQFKIQPVEFFIANNLPFVEASIIKYVCRHSFKNGKEDLQKAIHFCEILIEKVYNESN